MTIYIPYYSNKYGIVEADSDKARKIGGYWHYNGWVYGPTAYTTKEGAEAYISKYYEKARETEYKGEMK